MEAQNWRRQPSSYWYGPVVQRWTTHASLRRQAWRWRSPSVMIPLSGRVLGRASGPSWTRVDDGSGLQYFLWIDVRALRVFLMKWIYRRKGDVRGRPGGPHHRVVRLGAGPHHHLVWPARCPSPSLLWTLSSCQINRNFGFCFVQFQEYFLYNFSKIQK
jgi:hypothetical protein